MELPCYPDFAPISLELKPALHPLLSLTPDGVSEYTFANLYLFRKRYNYKVCKYPASPELSNQTIIISGEREGTRFFMTPGAAPGRDVLEDLFKTHDYWKGISDSVLNPVRTSLEQWGIAITEDRDNFDYLYLRTDLAELSGKKYHKKRNLVNAFTDAYQYREEPLTAALIPQAMQILDRWKQDKGSDADYIAAQEALALFTTLDMQGAIYYVNEKPAGWCLGESLANGSMFGIHFEKAIDEYKGIYQYINQAFAASLPDSYTHINREQDLGDEGLRQAKETYRPVGFVRKYVGKKS
ncbi:ABC transporter permease [Spirochaetia bacterium]|nr:ABC transporter permease [Spirochaetia bacterium]